MAVVKAPLLSLGARGKIAGTLVAFTWKGLKVMREYVVPTNPKTAAQTTQRDLFTACVSAWRNFLTNALERAAWNRSALVSGKPQSGFNAGMKALLGILTGDADASFCGSAEAVSTEIVEFTMLNMDDGATGDEAGDFEIWVGDSPASLLKEASDVAIAAGIVATADLGDTDDVKYVKLRKDGFDRSGIGKYTLVA